ncbi:MAG: hypothetical protein AAF623_09330 [Planctomycetota bacterium]
MNLKISAILSKSIVALVTLCTATVLQAQFENDILSTQPAATTLNALDSNRVQISGLMTTSSNFFLHDHETAAKNRDLNNQITEIISKIKSTEDESEKASFKPELEELLVKQYDLYLETHEKPLIELEERLAKLREEYNKRKNAKQDLIQLRLDTMWYDAIGMNWPGDQNPRLLRFNNLTGTARFPGDAAVAQPARFLPRKRPANPKPPKNELSDESLR